VQHVSLFGSKVRPNARRRFVQRNFVRPVQRFMRLEAAGGAIVVVAAIVALIWANSPWQDSYFDFWSTHLELNLQVITIDESLSHLVTDGLMVVFFFVVGLEIKRQLVQGELATARRAMLPVMAGLGGMLVPATLFASLNGFTGDAGRGWGIPVATDIAFALGVLALVGNRVPFSLKIFLLALAIADDLGGILVIAIFYTESISFIALAWGAAVIAVIILVRSYDIRTYNIYLALGALLWLAMYESGVHPTLAGVLLALLTPVTPLYERHRFETQAGRLINRYRRAEDRGSVEDAEATLRQLEMLSRETGSPLDRLMYLLHPWVSFVIVPLFALANAGVVVTGESIGDSAGSPITAGVILGLVLGKPLGIFLFTYLAVRLGFATLPTGVSWGQVVGVGLLGGVGFTVALFITDLAYVQEDFVTEAKMGILAASVLAGTIGFLYLRFAGTENNGDDDPRHGA
jgi:Na+:H+ antiporter, NhaA family